MSLRSKIIKLAHDKPALREHLLPLLKEGSLNTSRDDQIDYLYSVFEQNGGIITQTSFRRISTPLLKDVVRDLISKKVIIYAGLGNEYLVWRDQIC